MRLTRLGWAALVALGLAIAALVGYWAAVPGKGPGNGRQMRTRLVTRNKFTPPVVRNPEQPNTITTYREPRPDLRKALDTSNAILGVEFDGRKLEVHTISPIGSIETRAYTVTPGAGFVVDAGANVEVDERRALRRKRWKRVAVVAGAVVAAGVAVLVIVK